MNVYDSCMVKAGKISLLWRLILCIVFPPLAVFDKGCFSVGVVYLLTIFGCGVGLLFGLFFLSILTGWIPAMLVAMLICLATDKSESSALDNGAFSTTANTPVIRAVPMQLTCRDIVLLAVRLVLCVVFPPLAVIDKGCGAIVYVFVFTLAGWLPGTLLALLLTMRSNDYYTRNK